MITHFQIEDFQCHKKRLFKLGRITTFTGASGRGKSAVLRAFKAALLNTVAAKSNRRGSDGLKLSVLVDGRTVVRSRRKDRNVYVLDKQTYAALGKGGVPAAVDAALNVHELSFQDQHDSPLWFKESAGQVSKSLNQVVNLEQIDAALSTVASRVKKAKVVVEITEENRKAAKEEQAKLKWIIECRKDFARLTAAESALADNRSKSLSLASLISEATKSRRTKDNAGNAIVDATAAVSAGRAARQGVERAKTLAKLIQDVKTATAVAKQEVPDLGEVKYVRAEADRTAEHRRCLEAYVTQALAAEKEGKCLRQELERAEADLKRRRKVCPTCGQSLSRSATSTSANGPPSPGVPKKTGSKSRPTTSGK